ncbi:molybdenum cofactor biosynthesis protein MoaE [Thermasporomyces composti]|jgi:molybdopterin synthase catalytic subunit|uniref:Molybdopterin synthase catalytic subunit 1 n=1 Tax=Thermasporomyces composti TaxID=696763 RepID=A0A3D9V928_THECX|nr:molybdenum cofactor biosynthesis protein MoaE [Thermasporomyces composti]REF35495.1 molybdopterin synthase catalytic subunit [Thermasporomyces composti]
MSQADDPVRLIDVREGPLSVDEVLAAIADPRAGGVCLFIGTVRQDDGGRAVKTLAYEAHPNAVPALRRVAEAVAAAYPVCAVAAVHRVGELAVGETAVVVGVAAPHRAEAFAACRRLIDDLKATVPLWKHQRFSDGSAEWVGVDVGADPTPVEG